MNNSATKSSFGDFQDFIEDGSLTINNSPYDQPIDKEELEFRRLEMLKDNRLEKERRIPNEEDHNLVIDEFNEKTKLPGYSRPNLKYFIDKNERATIGTKNSFKFVQSKTVDDSSSVARIPSFLYKNHSSHSCKICQGGMGVKGVISKNLEAKYTTSLEFYNVKIINDIMYNEKVWVVSVFKDYLIYDDLTEFLKRSYTYPESIIRLSKIYEFYDAYSQVFPNYIRLSARKFMYKNIERKQRAIEARNTSSYDSSIDIDEKDSKKSTSNIGLVNQQIFTNTFMDSILRSHKKKYEGMHLEDVLDSFVGQSMSQNEVSTFLNESNYSIFSKSAARNATPKKLNPFEAKINNRRSSQESTAKKKSKPRTSLEPEKLNVAKKILNKKVNNFTKSDKKSKPKPKVEDLNVVI